MNCLICKKECKSNRGMGNHLRIVHNMSSEEYSLKFNLNGFKYCKICGKKLLNKSIGEYCNKHRDRSGKNNPMYGKTVYSQGVKKYGEKEADKKKKKMLIKNKKASKKLWENEEYRNKVINGISKPRHKNFKKEQSERIKKWFEDNPQQREIRSKKMKENGQNGVIAYNIHSLNTSKNKKELFKIIKERLKEYKVHHKTIHINNKGYYPDICVENKLIIEYYGDYGHANPKIYEENSIIHHKLKAKEIGKKDKDRINIFKKNNFNVLIVWANNYINNTEKTIEKVLKWINLKLQEKNLIEK